jgi:hypothetical protein
MSEEYWIGLEHETDRVFAAHPSMYDHRALYPWVVGALGDPGAGIWFVAENPSLTQIEKVRNPDGGPPTIEAQWWSSPGDKLLRQMLIEYGFKWGAIDSPGGWQCYITNVIKLADYSKDWREKTQEARNRVAEIWSSILSWELENSKPKLVVIMGKQTEKLLIYLQTKNRILLPRTETITHYAYIGQRAQGKLGPMHPDRIEAYRQEFRNIRRIFDSI